MSYLRWSVGKYVEGVCNDYVFCSVAGKGTPDFIEDYGRISDEGLVELVARMTIGDWREGDVLIRQHLVKRLAERLKVKLRETPFTDEEISAEHAKMVKADLVKGNHV